jgi:hypothetical protein
VLWESVLEYSFNYLGILRIREGIMRKGNFKNQKRYSVMIVNAVTEINEIGKDGNLLGS